MDELTLIINESQGLRGEQGLTGPTGATGVTGGIGPTGPAGADGEDGLSAYEIAVDAGFVGDEAAWLTSLVGADGADGADGVNGSDGASAYEVAVAEGFVGDESAWLESLVGPEGPQGVQGIQGEPGADGADGADGSDGADGLSAYQIAVNEGFVGDESAWLASLVGPAGSDGADGTDGADGLDLIPRDTNNALTANAGSSQGNGAITPSVAGVREIVCRYTTVATAGDCATLPGASGNDANVDTVMILNRGANAMDVFPASGGTIWVDGETLSEDAAASISVGEHLTFVRIAATIWEAL